MTGKTSLLPLKFIIAFGGLTAVVAVALIWDFEAVDGPESRDLEPLPSVSSITGLMNPGVEESTDAEVVDEEMPLPGTEEREEILSTLLRARISGTIVDPDHQPLKNAEVRVDPVHPESIQTLIPLGDYTTTLRSGEGGRFSVPVPESSAFSLYVEKEGFAPYRVRFALPGDDLEIVMQRGVTLTGVVVHKESDAVLEGATVLATSTSVTCEGETDRNGVFTVHDLPRGTLNLTAFLVGFDLAKMSSVLIQEDHENFVKITLEEGTPLSGMVLDKVDSRPVSGAAVKYAIGFKRGDERGIVYEEESVTDSQGLFSFEKVSRRGYRLLVSAPGYSDAICQPFKKTRDPEALMKIHLEKEGALEGRVFDPNGLALEGAQVKVIQRHLFDWKELATRTDASGCFLLAPLASGEIRVYASHRRFGPAVIDGAVVPPGGALNGIELYLTQTAAIEGKVSGPDGEPAGQVRVVLDGVKSYLTKIFEIYPVTFTDAKGGFRFDRLPEGEYRVSAGREGQRAAPVDAVLIGPETISIELKLEDGLLLAGVITDSFGEALDDVLVTAFTLDEGWLDAGTGKLKSKVQKRLQNRPHSGSRRSWDSPQQIESGLLRFRRPSQFRGSARSGMDGRFTLTGFREGEVSVLRLWKYGYNSRTLNGVPVPSDEILVELTPMCKVQGVVIDSTTFEALPAFTVSLISKSTARIESRKKNKKKESTAAQEHGFRSGDGTFLIESVKPDRYDLQVKAKGYRNSKPIPFSLSPGMQVPYLEIQMDLSGRLKGRVQGMNKAPVQGVTVFLRPARPGTSSNRKENKKKPVKADKSTLIKRAGPDGHFQFNDLEAGNYEVILGNLKSPVAGPKKVRIDKGESTARAFTLSDLGTLELKARDEAGFSLKTKVSLSGGPGGVKIEQETDTLGTLRLENIIPGKYKLTVSAKGYNTYKQSLTVKEGRNSDLDPYLNKKIAK